MIVATNDRGEIVQLLDISQFQAGRSAFECVAYSCALLKYAGFPGTGPTGTGAEAAAEAQKWYAALEGSDLASNTNGMSLGAEYLALRDMGLTDFHAVPITGESAHDIGLIKAWLSLGYPLAICGDETGYYDLGLGDRVPYAWTPTGNHCIAVSGIDAATGNLLVHDTANIGPQGVRTGPRIYDASKMHLVSATAVWKGWLPKYPQGENPTTQEEDDTTITINSPDVSNYFQEVAADRWHCPSKGLDVAYAMLSYYKAMNGLATLGLPISPETPVEQINLPMFANYAGHKITLQWFERGVLCYDANHILDNPPGSGVVYPAHLFSPGAPATDPRLWALQKQLLVLQNAPASTDDATAAKLAAYADKLKQINQLNQQYAVQVNALSSL